MQCQAGGVGVGGVLAALRAQRLGPAGTLRALYAGCGPTVACSALIGAVYLCSFYHTRRWAAGRTPSPRSPCRRAGCPTCALPGWTARTLACGAVDQVGRWAARPVRSHCQCAACSRACVLACCLRPVL